MIFHSVVGYVSSLLDPFYSGIHSAYFCLFSAVCDGVNLLITGGPYIGYPAFIRHLYYLGKRDSTRRYIITASPSCNYPDSVLGPAPNKALDTAVKYINHVS